MQPVVVSDLDRATFKHATMRAINSRTMKANPCAHVTTTQLWLCIFKKTALICFLCRLMRKMAN